MTTAETKTVYIVWTNTDLTEGRGHQVPIAICETQATATRLAAKKGVQGSNADVCSFEAVKHNNNWCAPFNFHMATEEDKRNQKHVDMRNEIIARAKAAGLTDDDIKMLVQS